jgi:hypothetical protein
MDIVERLRENKGNGEYWYNWEIRREAANEIERLRKALQKIAESEIDSNVSIAGAASAWAYCLFVAKAALKENK